LRLVFHVKSERLRGELPGAAMMSTLLLAGGLLYSWMPPPGVSTFAPAHPEPAAITQVVAPLWSEGEEVPLSPPRECAPSRNRAPQPAVPLVPVDEVGTTFYVIATGYSSTVDQTDSTPFITATNSQVRWGIVALSRDLLREFTPGAPFGYGDRIQIPGVGVFVVEDTMNQRWRQRIDIWFPTRADAAMWGVQHVNLVPA